MVDDGKTEPEYIEISSLVANPKNVWKFKVETEDNNLKDGTQTGDKEDMVWNL